MLKFIQKRLHVHRLAMLTSLQSLYRKPWATVATCWVIALTLVLPSLFWIVVSNTEKMTQSWRENNHIALYLHSSLSEVDQTNLLLRIRAMPGVKEAILKSPSEGLAELQKQEGLSDVVQYLPSNPLPAMIDVIPSPEAHSPESVRRLYATLKSFSQVEQAKLDLLWINRLHAIIEFAVRMALSVMCLLGLVVVFIVGTMLQLTIRNRQEEIQVLQWVGASDAYIARPFLYAGIWYGLAGALLALIVISLILWSAEIAAKQWIALFQMHSELNGVSFQQALLLLLVAPLLGWAGAWLSVTRQLRLLSSVQ